MTRYRRVKRDANHAEICAALRATGCSVLDLAAVGGGCPDLLVCRADQLWLLEVKEPDNKRGQQGTGKVTVAKQAEFALRWPVTVVHSVDQALRAVATVR